MEVLNRLVITVRTYPFVFVGAFLVLILYSLEHHDTDYLPGWAWPTGAWFIVLFGTFNAFSSRIIRFSGFLLLAFFLSPFPTYLFDECGPSFRANYILSCPYQGTPLNRETPPNRELSFSDATGKIVQVPRSMGLFRYPYQAAWVFESEYDVVIDISLNSDGILSIESLRSRASDMKLQFDRAAVDFVRTWRFTLPQNEELNFPLKRTIRIPFKIVEKNIQDQADQDAQGRKSSNRTYPLGAVIFHLLLILAAGSCSQNKEKLIVFFERVAVPYGLFLVSWTFSFMIAAGVTTNYLFLANSLLTGGTIILLGILSTQLRLKKDSENSLNLKREDFIYIALLLALGPALHNYSFLISDLDILLATNVDSYWSSGRIGFYESVSDVFNQEALLAIFMICILYSLYLLKRIDLERIYNAILVLAAAGIGISISFWFADMDLIIDDYVQVFSSLSVAAAALTVCTLAFCLISLPLMESNNQEVDRNRKNILLLELVTFFLFFAYAPVSISELGQSYESRPEAKMIEKELR
jgi:TonB family protein